MDFSFQMSTYLHFFSSYTWTFEGPLQPHPKALQSPHLSSSNSLFILPLQGPNVVTVSQRRAVRLTHVDISSASGAKTIKCCPRMCRRENELVKQKRLVERCKVTRVQNFNAEHRRTVWKECGQSASSRTQSDADLWTQSLVRSGEFNSISSEKMTLGLFSCPAKACEGNATQWKFAQQAIRWVLLLCCRGSCSAPNTQKPSAALGLWTTASVTETESNQNAKLKE